jgi:hypothetical protein
VETNIDAKIMEQKTKQDNWMKETVKEQVTEHLNHVEGKLTAVKSTLDEVQTRTLQVRDRENRACNIIMYNVPESKEKQKEMRWKEDRAFCLNMFNDVLKVNIRDEDIKRFLRLGKVDKSGSDGTDNNKERPVLIQFRDRVLKNMILDSLGKLREAEDKWKSIIFAHDMTKEDRTECRQLVEEAKKKESEDDSGEFIYRVRGSPGFLRIEKIRKRH